MGPRPLIADPGDAQGFGAASGAPQAPAGSAAQPGAGGADNGGAAAHESATWPEALDALGVSFHSAHPCVLTTGSGGAGGGGVVTRLASLRLAMIR